MKWWIFFVVAKRVIAHVKEYTKTCFPQVGNNFFVYENPFLFSVAHWNKDLLKGGIGFYLIDANSHILFVECCNNPMKSKVEANANALIMALRCLKDRNLAIKHIFISSFDLYGSIKNGNVQSSWRLNSRIFTAKNLINDVRQPQMHTIPRKWAGVHTY